MLSVISRVLKVDPLDPFDFTRAEREGREQARQAADFCCRYVPGFENAYLLDTSAQIGLRSVAAAARHGDRDRRRCARTSASTRTASPESCWNIDVWPADSYTRPGGRPR